MVPWGHGQCALDLESHSDGIAAPPSHSSPVNAQFAVTSRLALNLGDRGTGFSR
jgi:hypothetical protein